MQFDLRDPLHRLTLFLLFVVMAFSLVLQGCATKPVTPEDYVQSTKAQVGAAYKTIGDLKAQGSITAEEGRGYFSKIEVVEKQVATAELLLKQGKPVDAQSTAQLALNVLLLIQAELKKKGS